MVVRLLPLFTSTSQSSDEFPSERTWDHSDNPVALHFNRKAEVNDYLIASSVPRTSYAFLLCLVNGSTENLGSIWKHLVCIRVCFWRTSSIISRSLKALMVDTRPIGLVLRAMDLFGYTLLLKLVRRRLIS